MSQLDAGIGEAVGDAASAATGIPGLGQVAGLIGSFLGPKAHYTPSGLEFKQIGPHMYSTEQAINALYQRVYGQPLDKTFVPPNGSKASWGWLTGLAARYLNNPGLETEDAKQWDAMRQDGTMDAAMQAQAAYYSELQGEAATRGHATAPGAASSASIASALGIEGINPIFLILAVIVALEVVL